MTHTELNLKIKSTTWVLVRAQKWNFWPDQDQQKIRILEPDKSLDPCYRFLTIFIAWFYSSLATPEVNTDNKRYLDLWFSEFRLLVWSTGPILIWYFIVLNFQIFQNINYFISARTHDQIWPYAHIRDPRTKTGFKLD